jgi:hypothetical protein
MSDEPMSSEENLEAINAAISTLVEEGYAEIVGFGDDGEFTFRITALGEARVEKLLRDS